MSSGELPLEVYHRANAIGSGSYGSVVVVYDDEGEEYAMKLFDDEEEDEDSVNPSDYGQPNFLCLIAFWASTL